VSDGTNKRLGLRSRIWLLSYRTSSTLIDGRPVNILHDFYIPALSLAVSYDRVAGYFRSSSLAAASQGFSAFVGRQGKMRLVVGADLDPADVKAIIEGDSQRLEARLSSEIEGHDLWPESVRNGVALLGWMVKEGYLEVRVAFRVHGETGEPIPFGSVEDGYVHEKWFVLTDEFGNRLYGAGTLNESKTALVLNAENLDVHCDWWGEVERRRVDDAANAFEVLWHDRVRHLRVMTLPEAVKRRLISLAEECPRFVEIDGSTAVPRTASPPSALERLRFAVLRDAPKMPGGRLVGLETAPITPWPHQAVVVRRLVETWPYSYLLCDEVGLGKTIEAGLAFRCLYLSGLAKRILIAAPPGITPQWQRQMASKMLLSFGLARTVPHHSHEYIFPEESVKRSGSVFDPDLVIVSTGLLSRKEWAENLAAAKTFDIVLIDEAHAVRRRNPSEGTTAHPDYGNLYLHVRDYVRKNARSLWLATATPMQIHAVEVCDLLALTNRVGSFQYDPTLTMQYYEILGEILRDAEPTADEWSFLRNAVKTVRLQDPLLYKYVEEAVLRDRSARVLREWIDYNRTPRGRDRELVNKILRVVSPVSRVMLRHTRRLLEIYREKGRLKDRLPRRHLLPIPRIVFTDQERRAYESLEKYCTELRIQVRSCAEYDQATAFLLSFLRLRFASSLYAIRETLCRRLLKVEETLRHKSLFEGTGDWSGGQAGYQDGPDEEDEGDAAAVNALLKNRSVEDLQWERARLREMLDDLVDISGTSSKMLVLLQHLEKRIDRATNRIKQTVVFTRFYDTLTDILRRLREVRPDVRVGTYSGKGAEYYDADARRMVSVQREEVKERFLRGEIDVLLCTDAAAEGLNLQTADLVVNFDLGWNPMKVEQRIGRIDRIGQKHDDIYVLNLCYADSEEQVVYGRLLSRLSQANLIVGSQQFSLLPVGPEDFRKLAEGETTPEDLEEEAFRRLEAQRDRTARMEIPAEEMYEAYAQMESARDGQTCPVSLEGIWEALVGSQHLRDLGCEIVQTCQLPLLRVTGLEGIADHALLTVSREAYESGVPGSQGRVHFASYGDPVFDALLSHFTAFDLPKCVRRISVKIQGLEGAELVGYAIAAVGPDGLRQTRLVIRSKDLEGIELAETDALTEEEIQPLRLQLEEMAHREFEYCRVARRIERDNVRAALAQEVLNLEVIRNLLEERAKYSGPEAQYTQVLREVQSLFEDRERIVVNDLPASVFREISDDLLFEVNIPRLGEHGYVSVPRVLARSAIDAAERLADSLKVRRSEISVNMMLGRLHREIERRRR